MNDSEFSNPAYRIETKRLVLRCYNPSDALVKVAFELMHIHRLEIHCDPANLPSAAIPRKLGFTLEGTLRAKTSFLDGWSDSMVWGLLETEYPDSPSSKAVIKVFDADGQQVL